jgi:hypothetical protein
MITVIGILTGAVLGTRYKVLCLVPITLIATAAVAALDQLNEAPPGSTGLSALALAVGLQIGYLLGVNVRSVRLAALAERLRDQPVRFP